MDGFIKHKELLQALHEEKGWSYVRQSHINEVLMGKDRLLFHSEGKRIRVLEKKWHLDQILESTCKHVPTPETFNRLKGGRMFHYYSDNLRDNQ